MSEPELTYTTAERGSDTSVTDADTIARLARLLGKPGMDQLGELIESVIGDTRFGCVKIIISDGRVTLIKPEKSYKLRSIVDTD